jgi:L-alanine-DL-glutamate epimerase-like enolase superfamily enzyme
MQISDVEAIPVEVPLMSLEDGGIAPYRTNHQHLESVERVLVRVETDEGYVGWGEVRVYLSPEITASIINDAIASQVVGESPYAVEQFRRNIFIEYSSADIFFAPVEIACWDIIGQAHGTPIYKLLGGWNAAPQTEPRWQGATIDQTQDRSIPLAYCLGILSPEESAAKAESVLSDGYHVLKTKAGHDWQRDVQRILTMEEATGGNLEFRLDPNQGWSLDQAVRVAGVLEDANVRLQYLEQPIRVNTHESLRALRYRTTQPIGPNEDTYIAQNLRQMIQAGAIDVAVLDMTPAGGISGLRDLVAIAEDAAIPAVHHCAFDLGIRSAAIAHVVYGLPGMNLPPDSTYMAWEEDILERSLTIEDGEIVVPDGPGLGVRPDVERIEEYRIPSDSTASTMLDIETN